MNAMVHTFREMGQVKLLALAAAALLLLGLFMFMAMHNPTPAMSPLYSNVSLEDSGKIVEELEKANTPYELAANGTQILVPADEVARLRIKLAQGGMPSSGSMVGYEVFDKGEALGTSNFVLDLNKIRALEGELARTITSITKIETARVHLVMPKKELFTRDKVDPTASVVVKLRGVNALEKNEIAAVRHLVATAVPGLKPTRITIVDSKGSLLARGVDDENDPDAIAATSEEFRLNFENRTRDIVERLLERSLGAGRVRAEVNADIDFDRVVTNSETYDPEGQVPRSVQNTEETENSNDKDVNANVSAGQNLPNANQNQAGTTSQRNTKRTDETTNYEISKTVENHIKETGTVNKISVAVLVDGNYITDKKGEKTYAPRSAAELAQIAALVKSSIGFDEKRGDKVEVVNMKFAVNDDILEESPLDWLKGSVDSIVQTLVLGGIAVLVILMIVRPLVSRVLVTSDEEREAEEQERALLGGPGLIAGQLGDFSLDGEEDDLLISLNSVQGGIKSSSYKKINEMIAEHPEETLNVIRGWAFTNTQPR